MAIIKITEYGALFQKYNNLCINKLKKMIKRKEEIEILKKKSFKYLSEKKNNKNSFLSSPQKQNKLGVTNFCQELNPSLDSLPKTYPKYLVSQEIEEGALAPMFEAISLFNGEFFLFSFKEMCKNNCLLIFSPYIFEPDVLELIKKISNFMSKILNDESLIKKLAFVFIFTDSFHAIKEFLNEKESYCQNIYFISDFNLEIYTKFKLKNEFDFSKSIFLINFCTMIVKKSLDIFEFDNLLNFFMLNTQ